MRFREFFEEDGLGSMSRLVAFMGACITSVGILAALFCREWDAAFNFAGLLVGLSGTGYAVNRATSAYENVRTQKVEDDKFVPVE